jgi:nicotinamide-nucleotide amidase
MSPVHDFTTDDLVAQLAHSLALWPPHGWTLTTAESCTGGLIAGICTERAGASGWFDRGFVTYSNAAKTDLLGVPAALIAQHGAVSDPVVRAMVQGARARSAHPATTVAVAVTGIAGPQGGSPDKPVGTVWLGWAVGNDIDSACCHFGGNRSAVRQATVHHALQGLCERLSRRVV